MSEACYFVAIFLMPRSWGEEHTAIMSYGVDDCYPIEALVCVLFLAIGGFEMYSFDVLKPAERNTDNSNGHS
jgi:hypothetical protein